MTVTALPRLFAMETSRLILTELSLSPVELILILYNAQMMTKIIPLLVVLQAVEIHTQSAPFARNTTGRWPS